MHSTASVLRFVFIMTLLVALVLAFLQNGLKSKHDFNEALYSKKATLAAVSSHFEDFSSLTGPDIEGIFEKIEKIVVDVNGNTIPTEELLAAGVKGGLAENIDLKKECKKPMEEQRLPIYVYQTQKGEKLYIIYARGKGLWDEIWGCIALEDDLNTIAGVSFDHTAETPGLGAEIKDNKSWVKQFIGKKLYNEETYTALNIRKGGAKDPVYEVDGISGATITGDGVTAMLEESIQFYEPFLKSKKG